MVKQNVGLTLQSSIVEPLKRDMPYLTARTVAKMLNKLGLKVVRHLGTNKLFTTKEQLIKVAKDIGYEDEVLNVLWMHSCNYATHIKYIYIFLAGTCLFA